MVHVDPLGIWVEPKKSRIDRKKIFATKDSGEIVLSGMISEKGLEEQCRYVAADDVIKGLSWYEAKEYSKKNGKRLLKRREWYIARQFMRDKGIENDMTSGLWEFTDTLIIFSADGTLSREDSLVIPLKTGAYRVHGGSISKSHLSRRGGYVLAANQYGFPSEIQTKAEPIGPVMKPYYLPFTKKNENGAIVCAGDFRYDGLHEEQKRELSLLIVHLSYKSPFISFRLCSD